MNETRIRKTILVVEDSKLLRTLVQDALKKAGFGTYEAANGRDGLTAAQQVHPDLIILDVIMPVMDGVAMLQLLRLDEWGKSVPVILLTGESEEKILTSVEDMNTEFMQKDDKMVEKLIPKIKTRLGIPD